MEVPVLLGIDLGTSSVKVCAVDIEGNEVAHGKCLYVPAQRHYAPAEADTRAWWDGVRTAIRQTLASNLAVQAIGLSGQMHGIVAVDAEDNIVHRPIIWSDTRAAPYIRFLTQAWTPFRSSLLNRLIPGFAASILCWLSRTEPATLARTNWALQPKDWLGLRLTGKVATDASDASATGLWDFAEKSWHWAFCDAISIDPRLLPPVLGGDQVRGELRPAAADDLGLPSGVPVVVGRADTAASQLGSSSALDPGQTVLTLGTGGQLCQLLGGTPAEPPAGVMVLAGPGDDDHYLLAPTYSAGMSLDWARRLWSLNWPQLLDVAFSARTTIDCPLFYPFAPRPGPAPGAVSLAASWHGISPGHDRAHLLKSALEGSVYAVRMARDSLLAHPAAVAFDVCTLVGGGARDDRVKQLVADILEIPIQSPDLLNSSARGAALSACVAAGWFPSTRAACRQLARPLASFEPDPGAQVVHGPRYERFQAAFAAGNREDS